MTFSSAAEAPERTISHGLLVARKSCVPTDLGPLIVPHNETSPISAKASHLWEFDVKLTHANQVATAEILAVKKS